MSVQVDGRQYAAYTPSQVECGGAAIRAWGSAFTIANLSVTGT